MNVLDKCINLATNNQDKYKWQGIDEELLLEELRFFLQESNNSEKDISQFEQSISPLQKLTACTSSFIFHTIYEIYMYFLKSELRTNSIRVILNQKLVLIIRSKYLEEQLLCNLVNQLDKHTSVVSGLAAGDQLSLYVFFLEKIFQGHQKNLSEMIRLCSRFAVEEKKEYLEGLGLMIASDYKDNKQQKIKQHNGERIDSISMLILSIMNRISIISSDSSNIDENIILDAYNLSIKNINDFLKSLFEKVIEESGQSCSMSSVISAKNKNECQKIQLFLFVFMNDLAKQIYSPEYSIVPAIFNLFISILNTYINNTAYQNNHFIIDLTKSVLKLLYKDTFQILSFTNDMTFLPCAKAIKGKKSKTIGSVFCNMCSEVGFFSLKQNEDTISFCEECANFSPTAQYIPQINNIQDLLTKESLAFFQTLTYYYSDLHHKTQNSNFIDSRSTHIILHFVQQAYNKPVHTTNSKNKKITFFLNNLAQQTKFGTPLDSLGSSELDFLDFIYKSKVQNMFLIHDKLEFLLKYIFGLTNDNSSLIRNKVIFIFFLSSQITSFKSKNIYSINQNSSKKTKQNEQDSQQNKQIKVQNQKHKLELTQINVSLLTLFQFENTKSLIILNEIEGFNRSERFEQYIDIRRRDQQVSVRLTCLKILEELFTSEDQTQFESDHEYKKRKDRYFKMIMDRFNDKETQIRGTVLNFISNNLKSFAQDNQLKISLVKELIIRVLNDTREFQRQSLDILSKIYFPFFQGKTEVKKAVKKSKKETKKDKNILNVEEEKTLENILTLQKMYEINTEVFVRIFSHFQENQSDSAVILNTLLQVSLKLLDDAIRIKEERRFVLGVLEVLSKLKNGYEIYKEFQIFIQYFDYLIIERNQIPPTDKESRAETNLCIINILDIIINILQRNSFVSTPQIKNLLKQMEDKLINLIQREGNVYVLKKLVQLSAHSVNFSSQDIHKILDIFSQRYQFLKNLSDVQNLSWRLNNGDQNDQEILSFKITMSIYIVSIYAYNFMEGSFKALSITLKDIVALLLFYLSIQSERIQSASFENLSQLWEKEYDLIFSCQDILSEIIVNSSTSAKLLLTIYTIFDKYILKHSNQIKDKFNRQIVIKNAMRDENEDEEKENEKEEGKGDQEFEHITCIIRDLTIKSYEQSLLNPDLMLKKAVLRLLNNLISENLVLFQQIGGTVISLVCDPDLLTRTLANSIISEECLRNKHSIDKCLKVGLRKSARFVDENYKQFTITEGTDDKCQSLFERLNTVLKLKDDTYKDTNILCKRIAEVLNEIHDWSYEDHELSFFVIMLIISLNQITYSDLLILLNCLRSVSEKVYYDVKDFLKRAINNEIDYIEDEDDQENQRAFIKANILLMCLVTSHLLIIQSNIFTSKCQQIDAFIQRLSLEHLQGGEIDEAFQTHTRSSDAQQNAQVKVKWVRKFSGDRNLLENISDLFLEQMRDFDCSNQNQLNMLRSKVKHLFYDFVEGDFLKVLDLSHVQADKNVQSHYKSNQMTTKSQGKSAFCVSTNNVAKNKRQRNQPNKYNVHKAQNHNESSYHSCKGSINSHMEDLDISKSSNKSSTSQLSNPLKMNLRKRLNNKRISNIQEYDNQSDTCSQNNSKNDGNDDEVDYFE